MLNDGYYKSEIEQGIDENQLMQNSVGVGVPDDPQIRGSIYMWLPRFATNEEGDIQYINGIQNAEDGWTIPEIFAYRQKETLPDFLLTGVWVEINPNTNLNATIEEMNKENGKYGFIKNTMAVANNQTNQNEIQRYIVGVAALGDPITDLTNPNRIILKIINDKNQDPIKARGIYNKETGLIEIQATYSQYGINKILYEDTQELKLTKNGNKAMATSEGINVAYGTAKIKIIDNKGNTKELEIEVTSKIYVTLYTDGTLGFASNNNKITGKTVKSSYGDISEQKYTDITQIPWYNDRNNIKEAEIVDKILPKSTNGWFYSCGNLTTINKIENLDTSKTTDMNRMFTSCINLTSLDLSNFNTSNVTDMFSMFSFCSKLTSLDVSNFNTSNVTNMGNMFGACENLTELDLSTFDTSRVTNMRLMFADCSKLTSVNLSNLDTSNVTDMSRMFQNCSNLTELDLSTLDISRVTNMDSMFRGCNALTKLDLSNFDTSNVTNMSTMFYECSSLTSLDLSNFDTSNVTSMRYMFSKCSSLMSLDLSNFDTSNVTDMDSMFRECNALTKLDLSNFDTSNVTSMRYMFSKCTSLKTIYVNKSTVMWPDSIKNSTSTSSKYFYMFGECGTSTVTRI